MPKYEPNTWNDGGRIQRGNNCYDYAIDRKSGKFPHKSQPGKANGHRLKYPFTCEDVTKGAKKDGLKESKKNGKCGEKCWKVALAVDPTRPSDYHWYRQDENDKWSHKPGWGKATNKDFGNPSKEIDNPETADRGRYNKFCGYFCVCPKDVAVASLPQEQQSDLFASIILKETGKLISSSLELELPPGKISILYELQNTFTMSNIPTTTVYAEIYSGRENPNWQMTKSNIDILKTKIANLPISEPAVNSNDGYQGFSIINTNIDNLPEIITIYKGFITISDNNGNNKHFEDINNLEEWLVTLACSQSFGDDFKEILANS